MKDIEKNFDEIVDSDRYESAFRDRHHSKKVLQQLYVSPRTLLFSITLLNVIFFVGGTVYTSLQVLSIQERYEEAFIKITEAKQKYNQAEQGLRSIKIIEIATKNRLLEIERLAENLILTLEEKSKEGFIKVREIQGKSQNELELLRKSRATITASMNSYKDNTEEELKKIADQVALNLERDIEFNREEIKRKQSIIKNLGIDIQSLARNVGEKSQEISIIQTDIKNQLELANSLNKNFTNEIEAITKTDKITFLLLWSVTDIWVKSVFGLFVLLLSGLLAYAVLSKKNA